MGGKTALVTGATGFIGSNLARRLLYDGYETHILSRDIDRAWRVRDILSDLHAHEIDLRDMDGLKKVVVEVKPDYIFHLAIGGVYSGPDLSVRALFETNLIGTIYLLEASDKIDYKAFVNTGSSGEYGKKDTVMKETDMCVPANSYGVTKYAATLYASLIAKTKNKPIVTLRPFSPFGPYEDPNRLIGYAVRTALKGEELLIASPNSVRDFIYVEDIADAYMKCLAVAIKHQGEIFNIGSGREVAIKTVIDKIMELSGSKSLVRWNIKPPSLGESPHWQADISKAKSCLDWEPRHSLAEGLQKTIAWFNKNGHFYAKLSN